LHPSFNTFEFVRPYGARIIAEQYSPENLASEAQYTGIQLLSLLSTLPTDIRQIMRKISRGDLRVKVELGGYQPLLRKADQLVSRTIITLLAVAFLLFSGLSLMGKYSAEMAYHRGIPMLTWFGLGVTGFLLLILFILGLRKPRE
jgi:ubiquinone biosynthesis protein